MCRIYIKKNQIFQTKNFKTTMLEPSSESLLALNSTTSQTLYI